MDPLTELYQGQSLKPLYDGKCWRVLIGDIGPLTSPHSERDDALARKLVDQLPPEVS